MVILQHMGRGPYILVAFEQPGLHRRVFWGGGGGLRDRTLSDNVFNASHNHLSLINRGGGRLNFFRFVREKGQIELEFNRI